MIIIVGIVILIVVYLFGRRMDKMMIKVALKKYIIKDLDDHGFSLNKTEQVPLFSIGDFDKMSSYWHFYLKSSRFRWNTFVYLYINDLSNPNLDEKRITANIEISFWVVKRVVYSAMSQTNDYYIPSIKYNYGSFLSQTNNDLNKK